MPSELKILQTNTFDGGMTSDLAAEAIPTNMYRYMLNCSVLSSADGDKLVVSNVRGNSEVFYALPVGVNRVIGAALDEETNNLYYAVWNSEGYHSWYRFNSVDRSVVKVLQLRTDTDDSDIWGWNENVLILHANVIDNNKLYWVMQDQPARKFNIDKALDKSSTGYGVDIKEEYTRAYKKTALFAPTAVYFTDTTKKFNRLYGSQFKFAVRFFYDDGEKSNVSDWSMVPKPDNEQFTGTLGVPLTNNGINVTFETGSEIVTHIEVLMMRTNPEGGVLNWVSVIVLNKSEENISSNATFTYKFYNDEAYVQTDQSKVFRPYSFLPKNPLCQDFTKNALIYSNFYEGFPIVNINVDHSVRYDTIFIDDATENELNNPSITYQQLNVYWDHDRRANEGIITIGEDVKSGNTFTVYFLSTRSGYPDNFFTLSVTANLSDTAITIANKLASQLRALQNDPEYYKRSYVNPVEPFGGGARFQFRHRTIHNYGYFTITTNVNPVNISTLKDNGQSIQNIKLGSSTRYGLVYEDEDGRKSAVYSNSSMTVGISSLDVLGDIKKPVVIFNINHLAPSWAKTWQIVRTNDLVYLDYIQILIQQTISNETSAGEQYTDLVIGSLFAYQKIHPNTTLNYEFKKGDRVRLLREYFEDEWHVSTQVKDFEVLEYRATVTTLKDENITVNGTDTVTVTSASPENIGNILRVDGKERIILEAPNTSSYKLTLPLSSGDPNFETKTFAEYEIVNNRGVLRIKSDPEYPIEVDPTENRFALVEIYTPSSGNASVSDDQFFEFGQKYPVIVDEVNNRKYHSGNIRDQSISQSAILEISNGTSYVRNRELPTNMDVENAQILVGIIEDKSYSDFYVSDLNDNGRSNGLDQGNGEVHFDSRMRFSNNYIENTRINGLNDFDNLNREDYNDKYGAIVRILFEEGRLYVFKYLKCAWVPVLSHIITDQSGSPLLTQSSKLLDTSLQYFLWDGGVGDNPESIVRNGNNIYLISPNSGVAARIGGNGLEPISITYGLDRDIRQYIKSASSSNARIYGGFNRRNAVYIVSIESHEDNAYNTPFNESGWQITDEPLPTTGVAIQIVTQPEHGSVVITGGVIYYTPDNGYVGEDGFEYTAVINGVAQPPKHVCMNVIYVEGPKAWRPITPYCVLEEGVRTGYQGWTTLQEYLVIHGTNTGVTKPNISSDPDYVAPVYNITDCPPSASLIAINTDTDENDPYRLFVDVNVIVWINGVIVRSIFDTDYVEIPVNVGDNVRLEQTSNPEANPWPPLCTATFEVTRAGLQVHYNSRTTQAEIMDSYSFTVEPGINYIGNSFASSAATGYRKYKFNLNIGISGVTDIPDLAHEIIDMTDSVVSARKGSAVGMSEYNVLDDSNTCNVRSVNETAVPYEITVRSSDNSYNQTQTVDPESNITFTGVPKKDMIIDINNG